MSDAPIRELARNARERGEEVVATLLEQCADAEETEAVAKVIHDAQEFPGRTWDESPLVTKEQRRMQATAALTFLKRLGWHRPDDPRQRWSHADQVPIGAWFAPDDPKSRTIWHHEPDGYRARFPDGRLGGAVHAATEVDHLCRDLQHPTHPLRLIEVDGGDDA